MKFQRQQNILDNYIPDAIKEVFLNSNLEDIKYFIAGGACTSVFSNNKINDIDIFFYTEKDCLDAIEAFGMNSEIKSNFMTNNAISYSYDGKKFQLIKCLYGTPEEIIQKFDYTVVMCAYDPMTKEFTLADNFIYDLAEKKLVFNPKVEYPISSLFRSKKYVMRGYDFPITEMFKLSLAINNLKLETYGDVKKQLEGVDLGIMKDLVDNLVEGEKKEFDFLEFLDYIDEYLNKYFDRDGE
jgi:hypothetical protein